MSLNTTTQQSTNFTKQLGAGLGPLANNYKNASGAAKDMIVQQKGVGTSITQNISKFSTFAIGLSATATSALQLAAGFRDWNDANIAVDRTTRRVSLAQEALGKATDKLNALTSKGIKSGKQYEQAVLDQKQAQDQLSIQTQLLGEAQERLFDSQTQFAASVVPTVLGALGTLGVAFKDLGLKGSTIKSALGSAFSAISSSVSGLTGAVGGLGGSLSTLAAVGGPIAIVAGGLAIALSAAKAVNDEMAKITNINQAKLKGLIFAGIDPQRSKDIEEFNRVLSTGKLSLLDFAVNGEKVNKVLTEEGIISAKTGKIIEDTGKKATNIWDNAAGSAVGAADATNEIGKAAERQAANIARLKGQFLGLDDSIGTYVKSAVDAANNKGMQLFWKFLNNPNPFAVTTAINGVDTALKNTKAVFDSMPDAITTWTNAEMDAFNVSRDLDNVIRESEVNFRKWIDTMKKAAFDDFTSGLDKIKEAFDKFHKKDFLPEIKFDKAQKAFDKFLSEVGERLQDGGSKNAKDYITKFAETATKKMSESQKKIFQPILDWITAHGNEPPDQFMSEFLQVIGQYKPELAQLFPNLFPKEQQFKTWGGDRGTAVGDGIVKGLEKSGKKVKGVVDKMQADIDALHGKTIQIVARAKIEGPAKAVRAIVGHQAQGGLIRSAAAGDIFTTNGPQLVVAGDNPGGNETVAFIPHNNPRPTLESIAKMFGGGGGSNIFEFHIHVGDKEIIRRVKQESGKNRFTFGA